MDHSSTQPRPKPGTRKRGAQACMICNKRKIRCIPSRTGQGPCDNCKAFDYECKPHQRKRKRYSIVSSDGTEGQPTSVQAVSVAPATIVEPSSASETTPAAIVPAPASEPTLVEEEPTISTNAHPQHQTHVQTPKETADFVQAALTAQFGHQYMPSPQPPVTAAIPPNSSPSGASAAYLGRSRYIGDELEEHEGSIGPNDAYQAHSTLTPEDWAVLHLRRAFDLPCRPVCESLVTTFVSRCDAWMPVVEPETLRDLIHGRMSNTPLLLVQAVLMAGSRMQTESSMLQDASTQDLYNRAKVIFFSGYEKDPMTLVTAVTVLQYWNPSGPSHISIHNSSYWLRVGIGLVHQMGLHKEPDAQDPRRTLKRRVFWTLFARDSLLSAGQGRPRAIHLEDCNIAWPDVSDFPVVNTRAHLFVAYVKIAGLLGDLTQWHLRGCPDRASKMVVFEKQLKDWVENLPIELQVCDGEGNMRPYDCSVRFLYLPYFTAISILYKSKLPSGPKGSSHLTVGSTVAASCVARIFEDALARNEVRHGVAMQAIYLLIAGICQLGSYDYPLLWRTSTKELNTVTMSLVELSKTWQTAEDTRQLLQRLQKRVFATRPNPNPPPLQVEGIDFALFKPFGPSFCSKLEVVVQNLSENPTFRDMDEASEVQGDLNNDAAHQGMVGHSPRINGHIDEGRHGGEDLATFGVSPQDLSTSLLDVIGAEGLYSGENWFLEGIY